MNFNIDYSLLEQISNNFILIIKILRYLLPITLLIWILVEIYRAFKDFDSWIYERKAKKLKNAILVMLVVYFLPMVSNLVVSKTIESFNFFYNNGNAFKNASIMLYEESLKKFNNAISAIELTSSTVEKDKEVSRLVNSDIKNVTLEIDEKSEKIVITSYVSKIIDYIKNDNLIKTKDIKDICANNCTLNLSDKSYAIDSKFTLSKLDFHYLNKSETKVVFKDNYAIAYDDFIGVEFLDKYYSDLEFIYLFKNVNGEFKLESIHIDSANEVSSYLSSIKEKENKKEVIDKYIWTKFSFLNYDSLNSLSISSIESIYEKNKNSVFLLNTYYNSAVIESAVGFLISDGYIITTWDYVSSSLTSGQYITVYDMAGKNYEYDGFVLIDEELNIAVLKLNEKIKSNLSYKTTESDILVSFGSKSGYHASLIAGKSLEFGNYITGLIPSSKTDSGAPIFDIKGNVLGINTGELTNFSISKYLSSNILINYKNQLEKKNFNKINKTSFYELKSKYYYKKVEKEKNVNNTSQNIYNSYNDLFDFENNINLPLIKSNYTNNILSLRYENEAGELLSALNHANSFISNLIDLGYKEKFSGSSKIIYEKENDYVVIMEEFNYLIIIIRKEVVV